MIGEPLFDAGSIARRVRELGAAISRDYAGSEPLLVGLLTAAAPFLADLARSLTIPCQIDVIAVNHAGDGGAIQLRKDTGIPVEGRHVVMVDETVDTGMTLQYVVKTLAARGPASLAVCTLLD